MAVTGYSPLRDVVTLRDAMDRIFDDRWVSPGSWLTWSATGLAYLPIDVYETSDAFVVRAVVPGVGPDGIDIQYQQGVLTLRTKTEAPELEDGATWLVHEIVAGQSLRQITLPRPIDVDAATSHFDDGVLTLNLPKTPDAKPKQIRIGRPPRPASGSER
jgi:HSP20 family protein